MMRSLSFSPLYSSYSIYQLTFEGKVGIEKVGLEVGTVHREDGLSEKWVALEDYDVGNDSVKREEEGGGSDDGTLVGV